jgi:hypothetical protein
MMAIGAILTALGILGLAMRGGIDYKNHESIPHNAQTQVTVTQEKTLSISPLLAGTALAAGVILMIVSARK